jgi:outer membrane protein
MGFRVLSVGVLVTCLAGVSPSAGAEADGVRIAFVDLRKAVFNSREGKAAQQEFSRLEAAKLEELKPLRDELQRLEEELDKQKFLITEDALAERQLDIMKRRRDLERDIRSAEDELQLEQVRLLQPIQKKIAQVVEDLGKEKGFTMIVDKNTRGLLFSDKALEVTELVVQRLNGR